MGAAVSTERAGGGSATLEIVRLQHKMAMYPMYPPRVSVVLDRYVSAIVVFRKSLLQHDDIWTLPSTVYLSRVIVIGYRGRIQWIHTIGTLPAAADTLDTGVNAVQHCVICIVDCFS